METRLDWTKGPRGEYYRPVGKEGPRQLWEVIEPKHVNTILRNLLVGMPHDMSHPFLQVSRELAAKILADYTDTVKGKRNYSMEKNKVGFTREYLGVLFDNHNLHILVQKDFVLDNIVALLTRFNGNTSRALHDVNISLQSLGPYRSRDLSAMRTILIQLEQEEMNANSPND